MDEFSLEVYILGVLKEGRDRELMWETADALRFGLFLQGRDL